MQKIGIEGLNKITSLVKTYVTQRNNIHDKNDALIFGLVRLDFRDYLKTKNYIDHGKMLVWETNLMHWALSESYEGELKIYPFLSVFESFKFDDMVKNTDFYKELHEIIKNISELNYFTNKTLIEESYKELLDNINQFSQESEYDEKLNDYVLKSIWILEQLFDYRVKLDRFNVIYLYLKELNKNYLEKQAMIEVKNKIMGD